MLLFAYKNTVALYLKEATPPLLSESYQTFHD